MYKDLRIVGRPTRKKPGMREFFILMLCYSYFNRRSTEKNEFSLSEKVLADYFDCTPKTIYRWITKMKDLGVMSYAVRENAGKTGYYRVKDENGKVIKNSYVIPKYKKIRVGEPNEIKFVNVYSLDQKKLNDYLIETIDLDVFSHIQDYKPIFDKYIVFLESRHPIEELVEIAETDSTRLNKQEKEKLKKAKKIEQLIKENELYLDKKSDQDIAVPEFQCKYLREGCLRLTHEICNTVNPEHLDKINETNYWRSSHARNDMLEKILKTSDFVERDVNGSIYRLTYNLFHDKPLEIHVDIYQMIWDYEFSDIEWPDVSYRSAFKQILMPIYMKEHLIAFKVCQYEYIDKYYYGHPRKYKTLPKNDVAQYEMFRMFVELTGLTIQEFLNRVKNAMHKILNTDKFIGATIFIQESNLHILMKEKFLNQNIICANIYDGFYFKRGEVSFDYFYQVYDSALKELKNNLAIGIGSPIKTI